jgi:hypothetical protein
MTTPTINKFARGRPHNCGADAVRFWRAPGGEAHQNGITKSGHSDL